MKMRQAEEKKERERDTRRRRAAELQSQISIVGGRFVNEGEQNNYTVMVQESAITTTTSRHDHHRQDMHMIRLGRRSG